MTKRRRKIIKQKVLNYYREKANSKSWDMGLVDYLSYFGLSSNEVDYGCFIAKKFIDRVQIPKEDEINIFTLLAEIT